MLQGLTRPRRIVSLMSYPGADGSAREPTRRGRDPASPSPRPRGRRRARPACSASGLAPSEWIKLIARLGEIPDPTVAQRALERGDPRQAPEQRGASTEGSEAGGDN